jgi:N-dimethylarginine dimethylaminohydrolase
MPVQTHKKVFSTLEQVQAAELTLQQTAQRVEPASVLVCEPTYFEVKDAKNPHMEGNINAVDRDLAIAQWNELKKTYEGLGFPVHVLPAQKGLEDMVFAANQVLPGLDARGPYVILSEMVHTSRRLEVPYYSQWFQGHGYRVMKLSHDALPPRFEGQGDACWHPYRELLYVGYGFRTEEAALEPLSEVTGMPVIKLKLVGPRFYHLDTSLCALDENTAMVYPPAFEPEGMKMIRHFFTNIIEVCDQDALNFAVNAAVMQRHVILQRGSAQTCRQLRDAGFTPIEVETGEFIKSGGSVYCLKMMVY